MDPIGDDLLKVMVAELGYRERPGQHTKFGEWYSTEVVQDAQYRTAPWCDMFIAWAAERAGVEQYVGQFAWTPSHARWFETQGAWSSTPEPGALVFFDWAGGEDIKGIDHVGVVERVEGGTIHTIEANVDRVWLKRKVRDESDVVGYGLPRQIKERLSQSSAQEVREPGPKAVEVHSSPAADSVSLTLYNPGGTFPLLEPGPLGTLIALVLGWTFLVARWQPRPPGGGRHRRHAQRAQRPRVPGGSASAEETRRGSGTGKDRTGSPAPPELIN
ncbi:CHAP domain-containing protein [Planomonospora sp. ID67723]|uniref:CHAP domain-containing protein n=1 Tax=Planomonospora sp. ID67723 TaxID=2738134 RepID=UPI0018C39431|nr:CHAP domain-containing protein [Planomonospora sp. ID67723]MBG0833165.1 CHAP domain-containing protein [Planomonospora sp. ID67723]